MEGEEGVMLVAVEVREWELMEDGWVKREKEREERVVFVEVEESEMELVEEEGMEMEDEEELCTKA